ncbi:MAG: DUF4296 domain-containing protein [Methylococcaceae bacterium]|nr:DUF4296 domain-containing protein [Prolixibacteraceae bacterium]
MRQITVIILFAVLALGMNGCFDAAIPKPAKLIPRDKFVKMMVDIYLVQGLQNVPLGEKELKKVTQTDLYQSVLKKYSVADTVFVRSLIYYSSFPKDYEKMHVEIIDLLNESALQFKPQGKMNLEPK